MDYRLHFEKQFERQASYFLLTAGPPPFGPTAPKTLLLRLLSHCCLCHRLVVFLDVSLLPSAIVAPSPRAHLVPFLCLLSLWSPSHLRLVTGLQLNSRCRASSLYPYCRRSPFHLVVNPSLPHPIWSQSFCLLSLFGPSSFCLFTASTLDSRNRKYISLSFRRPLPSIWPLSRRCHVAILCPSICLFPVHSSSSPGVTILSSSFCRPIDINEPSILLFLLSLLSPLSNCNSYFYHKQSVQSKVRLPKWSHRRSPTRSSPLLPSHA